METQKRSLDVTNAEHIGYKYGGIEITVLGGIRLEGLDRLRVTLKVQVEHLSIRHNLDLYNDNQVEKPGLVPVFQTKLHARWFKFVARDVGEGTWT